MKRLKLPPDTRLNWRDPDMPLIRKGYQKGVVVDMEVSAEFVQQFYERKMQDPNYAAPQYKYDPTYYLKKRC
jgi:hypothetical protein